MNAGSSGSGQAFALRNCDAFFTATSTSRQGVDATANMVKEVKNEARAIGREIEVFTVGQIVCRMTQKEAEDYYRYATIEMADWGSVDRMMAIKNLTPQTLGDKAFAEKRMYFASRAIGGYPFGRSPDHIADPLADLSRSHVRALALSLLNYFNDR